MKMRGGDSRRGQILIFVTLSLTLVFGLLALVIDFAMLKYDQNLLDASTQAATLAGAQAMTVYGATSSTVTTAVTTYSAVAGNKNAARALSGASIMSGYPKLSCLSTLNTSFGIACWGPSGANAIVVAQQVTVPLFFLRMFRSSSVTLTSVATAAMRGSTASPYNVAIIIDTTQSMNSTDSDSNCNSTRIACASAGAAILLKSLSPCAYTLTSCGTVTNGNVSNSVDRATLFVFPPVTTGTVAHQYDCSGNSPTTAPYATPFPSTSTHQVTSLVSDYRASDRTAALKTTSNIANAVAGNSGSPCLQAIGGYGTYYAEVIYQAQAYLASQQSLYPGSKNVMVILSDGDATATCNTSSGGVCTSGDMPGASTTSGTYPSTKQECHQAITAAAAAASAGTLVYTVAYGATSSGCTTDTSPTITPCQTMEQMASSTSFFYSDYTATGGSSTCISASQPVSGLNQIFQAIATDLTVAKLIPNGTI